MAFKIKNYALQAVIGNYTLQKLIMPVYGICLLCASWYYIKVKLMQTITKITLPNPCSQQWNSMTQTNDGRFCGSCNKTVIDFTAMTNQQIISYLSAVNNVCGRIGTKQFTAVNNQLKQENLPVTNFWKRMVLAIAVLASAQYVKGQSHNVSQPKTEQSETTSLIGKVVFPAEPINYKTITGRVVDETGAPVINAFVSCGKTSGTTNVEGTFNLHVPVNTKSIEIKALGYQSKTIKINKAKNSYNIKVIVDPVMLGGLGAVKRPALLKRLYYSFASNNSKSSLLG